MNDEHDIHRDSGMRLRSGWVLIGFLIVAGYFLVTEHRAHLSEVLYYLPYLLLLACPLMHVFMHRGHGGHGRHGGRDDQHRNEATTGGKK